MYVLENIHVFSLTIVDDMRDRCTFQEQVMADICQKCTSEYLKNVLRGIYHVLDLIFFLSTIFYFLPSFIHILLYNLTK